MLPLRTVLFIAVIVVCAGGAPLVPLFGVVGYMLHYMIGPERQWWHAPVSGLGMRYSMTMATMLGIGILLNIRRLRYGKFLTRQEWLILLFLGLMWALRLITSETMGRYTVVDHPAVKHAKVILFLLMMTHVVTTQRHLNVVLWVMVIGAMILGLQAYELPLSAFRSGRLETVGGADFAESNVLATFVVAVLPLTAMQFLKSRWPGKILCCVSGVFATNAIILTRSRGGLVAIGVGVVAALVYSPRKIRLKVMVGLLVASAGMLYLTDETFRERTSTIMAEEDERDVATTQRLDTWEAAFQMAKDRPLGVGVGNFYQYIGNYIPQLAGRDAHNTYLRALTEVGWLGLGVLVVVIVNAFWSLRRLMKTCGDLPPASADWAMKTAYAMIVSTAGLLGGALFISLTYVEYFWWILALPVCLERAVMNLREDYALPTAPAKVAATRPRRLRAPEPVGTAR